MKNESNLELFRDYLDQMYWEGYADEMAAEDPFKFDETFDYYLMTNY